MHFYLGTHKAPLPGCSHKSCANCMRYALKWRKDHGLDEG